MSAQGVAEVAAALGVGGAIATYWVTAMRSGAARERLVLRERRRANRAHYAAVEAAEDDPIFSPDVIKKSVADVVALAAELWRNGASDALAGQLDADLIRAWARSRQASLGTNLKVMGKPSVDLLRVVNRDRDEEDRVVVRVRLRVRYKDPRLAPFETTRVRLDERWTFGHRDGCWVVLSMDGDPLAGPVLTAPLIPSPASDTERLREDSLAELASAQKIDKVALSELVSPDGPAALALLDLSLLDGRFSPALIGAQLAHLVETWEEAVTGSEKPLEELATADAREALLRPSPDARLVMHDAILKSWEATKLDLQRTPPTIEATLAVDAVRYVVTDNGDRRAGNETDPRRMKLTWTLELTDSQQTPWRLTTTNNPAESIPGWT